MARQKLTRQFRSNSPAGAGRQGAFNEAKRRNGIPVSQQPSRVGPNLDQAGKLQAGTACEFEVPNSLLVATAGEAPDLDAFLEGGWATPSSMSIEFWACLARVCEKRDSLLLRPFGSFDDIEAGVNIVGSPRLISRIATR